MTDKLAAPQKYIQFLWTEAHPQAIDPEGKHFHLVYICPNCQRRSELCIAERELPPYFSATCDVDQRVFLIHWTGE